MSRKTENYKLNQPSLDDYYDIELFNENAEIIDKILNQKADKQYVDGILHIDVGEWELTSLVESVSAKLTVTLGGLFKADGWRLLVDGEDISGKVDIGESFTTAPLIFENSDLKVLFEMNGSEVFTADLSGETSGSLQLAMNEAVKAVTASIDFNEFMKIADYDKDKDGVVDKATDSDKLGGHLPSYFAKQSDVNAAALLLEAAKAELDEKANDADVVKKNVGLPNALTLKMNGSTSTYKGTSPVSKTWYAPITPGTAGQVLKSNGSGAPVWGSVKNTDYIYIAASNSTEEEKSMADYVCDGIDDNVQIQAAVDSVPDGGDVNIAFCSGVFNVTDAVWISNKNFVNIKSRDRRAKVLFESFTDTPAEGNGYYHAIISVNNVNGVVIDNIELHTTYSGRIQLPSGTSSYSPKCLSFHSIDYIAAGYKVRITNCYIHGRPSYDGLIKSYTSMWLENNRIETDFNFLTAETDANGEDNIQPLGYGFDQRLGNIYVCNNTFSNLSETGQIWAGSAKHIISDNKNYNCIEFLSIPANNADIHIVNNFFDGSMYAKPSNLLRPACIGTNFTSNNTTKILAIGNIIKCVEHGFSLDNKSQCIVTNNICMVYDTRTNGADTSFVTVSGEDTSQMIIQNNISNANIVDRSTDHAALIKDNVLGGDA